MVDPSTDAQRDALLEADPDIQAKCAWLAGIIDGEGTVMLAVGSGGAPRLVVTINNTSEAILSNTQAYLDELGVPWTRTEDRRENNPKAGYAISVSSYGSLRLHQYVRPYMCRQVDQFDAAAAFLRPRRAPDNKRRLWTIEEKSAWEALRTTYHPGRKLIGSNLPLHRVNEKDRARLVKSATQERASVRRVEQLRDQFETLAKLHHRALFEVVTEYREVFANDPAVGTRNHRGERHIDLLHAALEIQTSRAVDAPMTIGLTQRQG